NIITSTNRVIHFRKQGAQGAAQWEVEDNSKATILVTKTIGNTTYNIARYKLTFKEETTPLTQHQVAYITSGETREEKDHWWKKLKYRSPEYMKEKLDLITSLDFDYGEEGNVNNNKFGEETNRYYYKYPFKWDNCTYAFYDGSNHEEGNYADEQNVVRWCEYAIMDGYYGNGENYAESYGIPPVTQNMGKESDNFFLYVDASDRPGTIATLHFEQNLCQGSELFVTAWIKSSDTKESDDAGVLFTIIGVDEETGEETPIYRHCSGQIRTTCFLDDDYPGMGSAYNDWFQVYFSFICDDINYDTYYLKVENYCSSTAGGDFYLDEVKVRVLKPTVEITQLNPTCDNDKTLMRMDINYESMLSRLGKKETDHTQGDGEYASADFIIINKSKYDYYLANYEGDPTSEEAIIQAIAYSIANESGEDETSKFPTLDFYLYYEDNTEYEEGNPNLGEHNDWFYKRRTDEYGNRMLSIDFYSELMPYVNYLIILEPHTNTEGEYEKEKEFARIINSGCTIETNFNVVSATLLKINGEIVLPYDVEEICIGETVEISAEARYQDEEGNYHAMENEIYFDWFMGSAMEFTLEQEEYGNETVSTALKAFRQVYPNATELEVTYDYYDNDENNKEYDVEIGGIKNTFTENQYNLLENYISQEGWNGYTDKKLELRKERMELKILAQGQQLVCVPIENESVLPEDAVMICLSYVEATFNPSGAAPSLGLGFNDVRYPTENFNPCLRVGADQINSATEEHPITVNLRGAKYVNSEESEDYTEPDHLGVVSYVPEDMVDFTKLYLIATDDPTYKEQLGEDFQHYDLPIGKIKYLYAKDDESSDEESIGAYMKIYFEHEEGEKAFVPKEGCSYTMNIYFEEKDTEGNPIPTSCYGSFPLEMKVVPKYLVWQGTSKDNWNDDINWRRADAREINKTDYTTNDENGTDNGYVPMLFTKVVIPKGSRAELYMAGFSKRQNKYDWAGEGWSSETDWLNGEPENVEKKPMENIMYDMMVYENKNNAMKTERYRVNLCDEIHIEQGAQLLHSEQLMCKKVWIDVAESQNKWNLVSVPLKGVVAGDWYTKNTGKETSEYYTDITFGEDNSRSNPLVYQRSWNDTDAKILNNTSVTETPSYVTTGWSSVYNDAAVPFEAGDGYSIKAFLTTEGSNKDDIIFRFPKADNRYNTADNLTREGAGKLRISEMVERSEDNPDQDGKDVYEGGDITVELNPTADGYCLIGNPFTACLSMKEFFSNERNKELLTGNYWTGNNYEQETGNAEFTSSGADDYLLPPYGAFFVKAKETGAITFTKDMQKLETDENTDETLFVFSIRAEGNGGRSSAAISYSEYATDGYGVDEDVIMLEDASWKKNGMPLVYTVADGKAVSVNSLKEQRVIPLGVFADEGSSYTLTFVGVDNVEEPALYDAETNTETPITEGYSITLEGATHGRYFIHTAGRAEVDIKEMYGQTPKVVVYSPTSGTIVVNSEAEIEIVEVYSVGGTLLKRASLVGKNSCTLYDIDCDIAIVRCYTKEGSHVSKLRIK
ncbi:MAG: hypothetical protein LUC91_09425, partial [Prevotella sp.]|nr:hypothetical protein [Prevotella sp.]